jgi:uncharacterized integral membrane protein (TIGR02327 family)
MRFTTNKRERAESIPLFFDGDFIMRQLGIHAMLSIVIYLVAIALAFQAVKAVKIENLIRSDKPFEAQTFLIFTAIALGYLVAQFVISFIDSSLQLSNLF